MSDLTISSTPEEIAAIRGGKREIYRPATDAWFSKLYVTDPVLGIADVDKPIIFRYVILKTDQEALQLTYQDLEVEEFLNQPEDSDERFGFVLQFKGIVE